jgi:site-specific DNA recombinase
MPAFYEETEKHFLSVAPSAESIVEGAFPFYGKAPKPMQKLRLLL